MTQKNAPGSNATESAHTAQNSSTFTDFATRCAILSGIIDAALLALAVLLIVEVVR